MKLDQRSGTRLWEDPELSEMRARVAELEETINAIRTGAVDALVVDGPNGEQVFTLQGAEQAYRILVEAMNEGAATLDRTGIILYCNNRFASMVETPLEKVLGVPFTNFIPEREQAGFDKFFRKAARVNSTAETALATPRGSQLSVLLSANSLPLEDARGICLVITDITQRKLMEEARRDLARSIIQAQERERQRVALELHDGINQLLASSKHRMHGIERQLDGKSNALRADIVKARELIERTIQEVRLISRNLRPSELDDLGLLAAMRSLASEFENRSDIQVALSAQPLSPPISPETELTIYRIFQEALTNAERHSRAKSVSVRLTRGTRHVQLLIRDDGHGFEANELKKSHFGLANMRERASHLNGTCVIQSAPQRGTVIRLRIPA